MSPTLLALVLFGWSLAHTSKADSVFSTRHLQANGLTMASSKAKEAIAAAQQEVETCKPSQDCAEEWSLLLRSRFYASYFTDSNEIRHLTQARIGIKEADLALSYYPRHAGVIAWSAMLWARYAEKAGILECAYQGVAGKLRQLGETLIAVDPAYLDGLGYRILGLVHYRAPRIPMILPWPSDTLADSLLRQAVKQNPNSAMAQYMLGDYYLYKKQWKGARQYLQSALSSAPDTKNPLEDRFFRSKIKVLLDSLERSQ